MKKFAKVIWILLILIIIVIAGFCFYYGFILNKASKPKNVYDKVIDKIDENIFKYFELDKDYLVGDDFQISGDIKYELEGAYYLQNSAVNPDDIKIYNKINNLNNSKTTYTYIQNNEENKLYKDVKQTIGEEEVLLKKTLIEDTTEYVYINGVSDKYINNGTNIYFENISNSNTTKDNIEYLHQVVLNSFKASLEEKYFEKSKKKVNVNDQYKDTYQMSIMIDDKRLKEILNSVIKSIKKDQRANDIVSGFYIDFENYKISDKERILDKNEKYLINIYTDKIWFNPVKYEIIHLNNNERETYAYTGDLEGRLTYIKNDEFKYGIDVSINHKTYLFAFNNASGKNIGKIKLDKNSGMYNLDVDLSLDNKTYLVTYSSKYKDLKKKESYTINDYLKVKYSEDDIVKFSGDIKNTIKINTTNTIKEEVGDVIIRSSLTEEEENNYNNVKDRLIERLEK